jgi:hypothetical protein
LNSRKKAAQEQKKEAAMSRRNSPPEPRRSEYAKQPEVLDRDAPALEGSTGREDSQGAEPGSASADDVHQPIGASRRSTMTGRHDDGMGANETEDGLTDAEEMTRQAAEDIPTGSNVEEEDVPVFDRGDLPPKV